MRVFADYARYYDLIYRDKDYRGEAEYTHNLIRKHEVSGNTVLNLGCGSGRHDRYLAEKGYKITGVDFSEEMLTLARNEASENGFLDYVKGDVRSVRLGKTFDIVLSLFHVMSYQVSDEDILASFATASAHVKPGGVFIFDCWYGPGVLTDRPAVRIKEQEDENLAITRIAHPVMRPNVNVVDVEYLIFVKEKPQGYINEIRETHRMRYLFQPEVRRLLSDNGFTVETCEEWLSGTEPGFSTWNVVFVCRKRK